MIQGSHYPCTGCKFSTHRPEELDLPNRTIRAPAGDSGFPTLVANLANNPATAGTPTQMSVPENEFTSS